MIEWCIDYNKRVDAINQKPVQEQELRLRLFQLIPEDKIPGKDSPEWATCNKARAAYDKANAALDEARVNCDWNTNGKAKAAYGRNAYDNARDAFNKAKAAYNWNASGNTRAAYDKAWAVYDKARAVYDKAGAAYDKAWNAYIGRFRKELEALHTELCHDCPWNGETIFSQKGEV